MLKPLLRTTILASILFLLLVYMGMKYHWIDAFKKEQRKVTIIKDRGHMDISDDAGYYKIMQDFIGKAQ